MLHISSQSRSDGTKQSPDHLPAIAFSFVHINEVSPNANTLGGQIIMDIKIPKQIRKNIRTASLYRNRKTAKLILSPHFQNCTHTKCPHYLENTSNNSTVYENLATPRFIHVTNI